MAEILQPRHVHVHREPSEAFFGGDTYSRCDDRQANDEIDEAFINDDPRAESLLNDHLDRLAAEARWNAQFDA